MLIQTIIDYLLVMFAEQRYVYRTEDDFKVEPEIGRRQVHFSIGFPQTGRSNLLLSGNRASVYTSMSHPGCDVFFFPTGPGGCGLTHLLKFPLALLNFPPALRMQ